MRSHPSRFYQERGLPSDANHGGQTTEERVGISVWSVRVRAGPCRDAADASRVTTRPPHGRIVAASGSAGEAYVSAEPPRSPW